MEVQLNKMKTSLEEVVDYQLNSGEVSIDMNALVGHHIHMRYQGKQQCAACGGFKKLFAQGFCYNCFTKAPEASPCIIRPEVCEGHLGKGRDVKWEEENHVQPHFVYLAVASSLKIGVTRATQIPTRWIDQGASYAIKVAETPYRKIAGDIEVALKGTFTDKTNWRSMLKNEIAAIELEDEKWQIEELLPMDLAEYMTEDDEIIHIEYPVLTFPDKVKSLNFDKQEVVEGKLLGIKGQYLLLDNDRVINLRKHKGYYVDFEY
ncbi:MAG: DUF2797 domain-containing protein [Crocinitomicaceae bacterium]